MDKNAIHPFTLRDFFLVQRLQRHGQVMDYEGAGVNGVFPLRDALQGYLPLGTANCQTMVMSGRDAFAQYTSAPGSKRVHLSYVAPALTHADHTDRWLDLLEHMVSSVGALGVHHIVAEVQDDGPELELLQRLGFGIFTRQQLFRLKLPAGIRSDPGPLPGLRPWRSTDDWGLRLLYANTVPQLVQQIEASTDGAFSSSRWTHRLVLERDGEIIAGLATRVGRTGSALRLLLHPEADLHAEALIQHGVLPLLAQSSRPVYCRVRRYESWLHTALEACGFERVAQTVLLVKHTVGRVITPAWNPVPVVEGRAEMTSPVAQTKLESYWS